jgi:hypothetical protein
MRGCFSISAAVLLVATTALAGSLEGRWRLVEQTHGEGRFDTVDLGPPLRLEFVRQGSELVGRTRDGTSGEQVRRWPALRADEGTLRVDSVEFSRGEDSVRARYSVTTGADDRVRLDFVESYRVGRDARTLTGTVTVSLVRDGVPGGSYVVRRRFEREP